MKRNRRLSNTSVQALVRLLAQQELSEEQIERGIEYAEVCGATTMRSGFELAMSAALYSDAQLQAGMRFTFAPDA